MKNKFKIKIDLKKLKDKIPPILKKAAKNGVSTIRNEIDRLGLVKTRNMRQSVSAKAGKTYISFKIADYSSYLNRGIRKHSMKYLANAAGPIPFKKGRSIKFRVAGNIGKRGAWIHPGFNKGKGFIDRSEKAIRKDIANRISKIELS